MPSAKSSSEMEMESMVAVNFFGAKMSWRTLSEKKMYSECNEVVYRRFSIHSCVNLGLVIPN